MIQIGMPCSPSMFSHFLSNPKPWQGLLSRSISPSSPLPPDCVQTPVRSSRENMSTVTGSLGNAKLMKCRLNLQQRHIRITHWHWFSVPVWTPRTELYQTAQNKNYTLWYLEKSIISWSTHLCRWSFSHIHGAYWKFLESRLPSIYQKQVL